MTDWAMERAEQMARMFEKASESHLGVVLDRAVMLAFAAYIREHEQSPVDPDLIEARKTAASYCGVDLAIKIKDGLGDNYSIVKAALDGIKRGRELSNG